MRMIWIALAAAFALAACGGGVSSYEEGIEAQMEIMEEMVEVLEGVSDDASAEKAAGKIEALGSRLAELAKEMQKLPPPSQEELLEIVEEQREHQREFQQEAAPQMMKLAQYPALRDAWMRALTNMR